MIAITGASGKTGQRTAEALLNKGEKVRVIGRSKEHLQFLVQKGAESLIGDQADVKFLTNAFQGCSAAYVLIPPKMDATDVREYYNIMGDVMIKAVKKSGLRKLVFLSSLGAELDSGTGPVIGLHDVEEMLGKLTKTHVVFLRPGYFYENTLMNVGMIRDKKLIANSMDADAPILMVATKDIGDKAAELLANSQFTGHTIVELFGERITYGDVTKIIGDKIGIPSLQFFHASEREAITGMMSMGLSKNIAESFVELAHAVCRGAITTTNLDPAKPNAPTAYSAFVDEVLYPMYKKAA
jgi:uncharacterized protein YbjT (DUF2867 family)